MLPCACRRQSACLPRLLPYAAKSATAPPTRAASPSHREGALQSLVAGVPALPPDVVCVLVPALPPSPAFVYLAQSVMSTVIGVEKSKALVQAESVYHPPNFHPLAVGSAGLVAVLPSSTVCAAGAVPWPLASKVTAWAAGVHFIPTDNRLRSLLFLESFLISRYLVARLDLDLTQLVLCLRRIVPAAMLRIERCGIARRLDFVRYLDFLMLSMTLTFYTAFSYSPASSGSAIYSYPCPSGGTAGLRALIAQTIATTQATVARARTRSGASFPLRFFSTPSCAFRCTAIAMTPPASQRAVSPNESNKCSMSCTYLASSGASAAMIRPLQKEGISIKLDTKQGSSTGAVRETLFTITNGLQSMYCLARSA